MSMSVGIYIFDYVEILDFAGPYEVFTTASRMHARTIKNSLSLFRVFTIAQTMQPITTRAGLKIYPDYSLSEHPPIDCLIVPGGVVTTELDRVDVINWIGQSAATARITASVCTGAFLLAKAQLLDGRDATTHWEDIDDLKAMFPAVSVLSGRRWVDVGSVVSSAGISAGIDMSLHLVERLASRELAERTARQMEFDWTENAQFIKENISPIKQR